MFLFVPNDILEMDILIREKDRDDDVKVPCCYFIRSILLTLINILFPRAQKILYNLI